MIVSVLTDWAEHDDARMPAWRICADIAESAVEGQQHPVLTAGGTKDGCIVRTRETFVRDRVDVVAISREVVGEIVREVLVELKLHLRSGMISSRASAAP